MRHGLAACSGLPPGCCSAPAIGTASGVIPRALPEFSARPDAQQPLRPPSRRRVRHCRAARRVLDSRLRPRRVCTVRRLVVALQPILAHAGVPVGLEGVVTRPALTQRRPARVALPAAARRREDRGCVVEPVPTKQWRRQGVGAASEPRRFAAAGVLRVGSAPVRCAGAEARKLRGRSRRVMARDTADRAPPITR